MSSLARKAFNKKHNMPDFKVMGTISDTNVKNINHIVKTSDQSKLDNVVVELRQILKCNITEINMAQTSAMLEGHSQYNPDYNNPIGAFIVVTEGNATLDISKKNISLQIGKIYFINERNSYGLNKMNTENMVMMRGKFLWDKEIHGS